jgi:putative SOS response-associated peptidase YedK
MLTMALGPDVAPCHDRQIVILERNAWADWLDASVSARSLIRPLPAGTLSVEQVG